jgi:heat shock protein HslJ
VNAAPTPVPPTPVANPLANTRWDVVNFNNGQGAVVSMLADTLANVNFGGDGTMNGNGGCNNFNSSYQVNGSNITISPPGMAQAFCADPEGIMDQEAQILAALQSAATFSISGNTLEMRTGGDAIALVLQRAP